MQSLFFAVLPISWLPEDKTSRNFKFSRADSNKTIGSRYTEFVLIYIIMAMRSGKGNEYNSYNNEEHVNDENSEAESSEDSNDNDRRRG